MSAQSVFKVSAMQSEELASLPVGTEVSAKYKGAFCEAKVKKVARQVKCRVTFKQGLGSFTLSDESIKCVGPLLLGANVEAKHPDSDNYIEAIINKIQDQSQYTVVFDDGDIATLRRNALCMKSGKHFSASESLDNLPLTHPEHFGTPVGLKRRGKYDDDDDDDSSSDEDESGQNPPYLAHLGRVICVEVTDKKSKETWFPGLVVAPTAQETVKINTREDYLVRSFRDHRFYTVPKKECKRFSRDCQKGQKDIQLKQAVDHAVTFLDTDKLPPHWDREILFDMRDESSTEASSEEDESIASDEEDEAAPEEKDHLVAELFKHMDDRGTPINKNPVIGNTDVDLYKLFKLVQKLGGANRVTNNCQWRTVARKIGFETNWCINQVRVCYKRYLQSFEELYKTLGCTMVTHTRWDPRSRHASGRALLRGARSASRLRDDEDKSDKSSVSSQDSSEQLELAPLNREKILVKEEIKEEILDEIDFDFDKDLLENVLVKVEESSVKGPFSKSKSASPCSSKRGSSSSTTKNLQKEAGEKVDVKLEESDLMEKSKTSDHPTKKGHKAALKARKEKLTDTRMKTRPRRDSSSSLAAATELKAKKDEIGEIPDRRIKESKDDKLPTSSKDSQIQKRSSYSSVKKEVGAQTTQHPTSKKSNTTDKDTDIELKKLCKKAIKKEPEEKEDDDEVESDVESTSSRKRKGAKRKQSKAGELGPVTSEGEEEPQHLKPNVICAPMDKIKVFWLHGQIYEAKIMKVDKNTGTKYPRYFVHYLGWNTRYDEWITRGRIAENINWNSNQARSKSKPSTTLSTTTASVQNLTDTKDEDNQEEKVKEEEKTNQEKEEKKAKEDKAKEDKVREVKAKGELVVEKEEKLEEKEKGEKEKEETEEKAKEEKAKEEKAKEVKELEEQKEQKEEGKRESEFELEKNVNFLFFGTDKTENVPEEKKILKGKGRGRLKSKVKELEEEKPITTDNTINSLVPEKKKIKAMAKRISKTTMSNAEKSTASPIRQEKVTGKKLATLLKKNDRVQKIGKPAESPTSKRTESPAAIRKGSPAPSPMLKRQSSRNSLYKPSDESDKCESDNDDDEKPKDGKRRSARMLVMEKEKDEEKGEKEKPKKGGSRAGSVTKNSDVEEDDGKKGRSGEDEEEKVKSPAKTLKQRRPLTPSRPGSKSKIMKSSEEFDPYDFKEPEPFEAVKYETPRKGTPEKKSDEKQDVTKCEVILTPVKSPTKEEFVKLNEEAKTIEDMTSEEGLETYNGNVEIEVKENPEQIETLEEAPVKECNEKTAKDIAKDLFKEVKECKLGIRMRRQKKIVEKEESGTSSEDDKLNIVVPDEDVIVNKTETTSDENSSPQKVILEEIESTPLPSVTEENSSDIKINQPTAQTTPPEIKETEPVKGGKPVLQLPERYALVFPYLASLQTVPVSKPTISSTLSPGTPTTSSTLSTETSVASIVTYASMESMTSATLIGSIVGSVLGEMKEDAKKDAKKEIKTEEMSDEIKKGLTSLEDILQKISTEDDEPKTECLAKTLMKSSKPTKTKKKTSKKIRGQRSMLSREVVTSDSDSDSDANNKQISTKIKPVSASKRRKPSSEEVRNKLAAKRPNRSVDLFEDEEEEEDDDKTPRRSGRRKRKGEEDDDSLVCQETIPGSPVHVGAAGLEEGSDVNKLSLATPGDRTRDRSRLEMPFATVPEYIGGARVEPTAALPADAAKIENLPASLAAPDSPPGTSDSSVSGVSPAATRSRESRPEGSKSPEESSEVDLESLNGNRKAGSEDSRLDVECSSSSDTRLRRGRRRQLQAPVVTDSPPSKRKRRTRESAGRGRGKGRGRHGSGMGRPGRNMEDTDDSEAAGNRGVKMDTDLNKLEMMDNAALASMARPKTKYNFYVELNPTMEPSERIYKLQTNLDLLRKTYQNLKSELSVIERRRKKIRRKEREKAEKTRDVEVAA